MKKAILFLILIPLLSINSGCSLIDSILNPAEKDELADDLPVKDIEAEIFKELKDMELDESYVSFEDNELTIRFETPIVNEELLALFVDIAQMSYMKTDDFKKIKIQAYLTEEAMFGFEAEASDLKAYLDGDIDLVELYETVEFKDLRSPEILLTTDLANFDVVIEEIAVDDESVTVILESLTTDEREFWREYLAMALIVIEDVPWTEEVTFEFTSEDYYDNLVITAEADDILDLYDETITPAEFIEKLSPTGGAVEPKDIVQQYYDALSEQNYGIATKLLTTEMAEIEPWNMDAVSTAYKILDQKIEGDNAKVYVEDTLVDYDGVEATKPFVYLLVKEGDSWIIENWVDKEYEADVDFGDADETGGDLNKETVEYFLDALKNNLIFDAKFVVTENFINSVGEDFFKGFEVKPLTDFKVLEVKEVDGNTWVFVEEIWISGPEYTRYKLVQGDEMGPYIDRIEYDTGM